MVVDGQQRITGLVNAVDPKGMTDRRFAVGYSLRAQKAVLTGRNEGSSVIPLPDLFDFGRAPEWLRKNPDASIYAELIQDVAGLIQDVAGLIQDVAGRIKSPFQPQSWNRLTKTLCARPSTG